MSRVGRTPIAVPDGVTVTVAGDAVAVTGPKGEASLSIPPQITVAVDGDAVTVDRDGETKPIRQLHGTVRSRIENMVVGVSRGFERKLEIQGVGYRAQMQGANLDLSLGTSHPLTYAVPEGIDVAVENNTEVTVRGVDKQLVGAVAAKIRSFYPPEPYKGKGIRYADEQVRRKAGKTVAG